MASDLRVNGVDGRSVDGLFVLLATRVLHNSRQKRRMAYNRYKRYNETDTVLKTITGEVCFVKFILKPVQLDWPYERVGQGKAA